MLNRDAQIRKVIDESFAKQSEIDQQFNNHNKLIEVAKVEQSTCPWAVLDVYDIPNASNMTTAELLEAMRLYEPCLDGFAAEEEKTTLEWLEDNIADNWYTVNPYGVISWVDGSVKSIVED